MLECFDIVPYGLGFFRLRVGGFVLFTFVIPLAQALLLYLLSNRNGAIFKTQDIKKNARMPQTKAVNPRPNPNP